MSISIALLFIVPTLLMTVLVDCIADKKKDKFLKKTLEDKLISISFYKSNP